MFGVSTLQEASSVTRSAWARLAHIIPCLYGYE